MGPKTSSTSKSKHIISITEDDDGEDEVDERLRGPSQTRGMYHKNYPEFFDLKFITDKTRATLGNPTDVDEEGLLVDIDVQPVHNTASTYGDCYCCLCCVRATLQSSFHCFQSLVDLCLTPQALGLFVECWGVVVV